MTLPERLTKLSNTLIEVAIDLAFTAHELENDATPRTIDAVKEDPAIPIPVYDDDTEPVELGGEG